MNEKVEPKTPKEQKLVYTTSDIIYHTKAHDYANPENQHFLHIKTWVDVEGLVAIIKDRIKDLETSIKSASKFSEPLSLIAKQRAYEEFLVLLGAKELSDEFMETLRKSQEDKKAGKVRPYEEIAKECGLGTKKEKEC